MRFSTPSCNPGAIMHPAAFISYLPLQIPSAQNPTILPLRPPCRSLRSFRMKADPASKSSTSAPPPLTETPSVPASSERRQYSLRTRLREETEAPFRKARMFVYAGSAVSAGVGAFIASLRVIAALVGISGTQPLSETVPNVGINLGVIAFCAALLRFETKAGEKRLERMSRGARIGNLRVEDSATRQVLQLKELRGKTRLVLVAGKGEKVREAMEGVEDIRDTLEENKLMIVPFVAEEDVDDGVGPIRGWRKVPFSNEEWKKWYSAEREVVKNKLGGDAEVIVVVVRMDGKVGARSVGKPMWDKLIEEVKRLPKKDQYGKP